MKGIKKLNVAVKRKVLPLLLAGTVLTLTGCNGKVDMKDHTVAQLMEIDDIKDKTLLDELMEAGYTYFDDEITCVDAADLLKTRMDIVELLSDMDFSEVKNLRPLSSVEYEETEELSLDEVKLLKQMATTKKTDLVSMENKLFAMKNLAYLYDYCNEWIEEKGATIATSFMLHTVKAALADELNLSVEDYKKISLPPVKQQGGTDYIIYAASEEYTVPQGVKEIWNTIDYIYQVQHADSKKGLTDKTRFATFRKAINYGKTTLACGMNIKNGKIDAEDSASYVKKNYCAQ